MGGPIPGVTQNAVDTLFLTLEIRDLVRRQLARLQSVLDALLLVGVALSLAGSGLRVRSGAWKRLGAAAEPKFSVTHSLAPFRTSARVAA